MLRVYRYNRCYYFDDGDAHHDMGNPYPTPNPHPNPNKGMLTLSPNPDPNP